MQLREPLIVPSLLIWHLVVFHLLKHSHQYIRKTCAHTIHVQVQWIYRLKRVINARLILQFTIWIRRHTFFSHSLSLMNSSQILTGIIWYQEHNECSSHRKARIVHTNEMCCRVDLYIINAQHFSSDKFILLFFFIFRMSIKVVQANWSLSLIVSVPVFEYLFFIALSLRIHFNFNFRELMPFPCNSKRFAPFNRSSSEFG